MRERRPPGFGLLGGRRTVERGLLGGLDMCVCLYKRMLNRLIRTNRPTKNFPLVGIFNTSFQHRPPEADTFCGNNKTLPINFIENLINPFTFLANQGGFRDSEILEP